MSDYTENPFDDDLGEGAAPEPAASGKPARKTPAGRKRNPVDRSVAKRVVEKFQRIESLPPSERDALAAMLDVDPANLLELTCRALDGAREASRAVDDIIMLRQLEPTARGVEATVMALQSRDRFKAAWNLLTPYSDLAKDAPGHPSKAGLAFAEAAAGLTAAQLDALQAPLTLID